MTGKLRRCVVVLNRSANRAGEGGEMERGFQQKKRTHGGTSKHNPYSTRKKPSFRGISKWILQFLTAARGVVRFWGVFFFFE